MTKCTGKLTTGFSMRNILRDGSILENSGVHVYFVGHPGKPIFASHMADPYLLNKLTNFNKTLAENRAGILPSKITVYPYKPPHSHESTVITNPLIGISQRSYGFNKSMAYQNIPRMEVSFMPEYGLDVERRLGIKTTTTIANDNVQNNIVSNKPLPLITVLRRLKERYPSENIRVIIVACRDLSNTDPAAHAMSQMLPPKPHITGIKRRRNSNRLAELHTLRKRPLQYYKLLKKPYL